MDKSQAKISIKNLQTEAASLNPSVLIDLFEIDISIPAQEIGLNLSDEDAIFRFHNQIKLLNTSITWNQKEYIAAPIFTEGFEKSSDGALPTPRISITVSEAGIPLLALLKDKVKVIGDLVGCKLTRYRTFAAFLSNINFNVENKPFLLNTDEYAEFPPEIWFFNRKTRENKLILEYELRSVLDVEGIKLPRRQMIAKRCNFTYRGEGCLYEYSSRANDDIHGEFAILPIQARPVATEEDKSITDILGISSLLDAGEYTTNRTYNLGEFVYIVNQGVKYYFVAKSNGIISRPPDPTGWIADKCSKCIRGCKLRWGQDGSVEVGGTDLIKGELPFGGFFALEPMRA